MDKYTSQIRQVVLMNLATDLAIYPVNISEKLNCPLKVVKEELIRMVEEEILEPIYEMRCYQCGEVIATSEGPFKSTGQVECPGCYCQMESALMNPVVDAYIRLAMEDVC